MHIHFGTALTNFIRNFPMEALQYSIYIDRTVSGFTLHLDTGLSRNIGSERFVEV